jgi:hypothetical protein
MNLIISEAIDRKKLILTLKNWLTLSLRDTLLIVNNLPYIEQNIYYRKKEIIDMFHGIAIFSFEKSEDEKLQEEFELAEAKVYLEAAGWFDSLSKKEKEYYFLLNKGPS